MKLSVLISVYAKENSEYLNQALESIWDKQVSKPDQVVLVKDGPLSTKLNDAISQWQKKLGAKLTIVELSTNVGLGAALNAGLKACKHELVARMDSDDVALPDRFEKQLSIFTGQTDLDIVGAFSQEIDNEGIPGQVRRMPVVHSEIFNNLYSCPLIHPTVMYKKSRILGLGGYDSSLKRRQDYELWFRCAHAGMKFQNIPEVLLLYRFTAHTHSRQNLRDVIAQARIGARGVKLLNQPYWKSVACYIPVLRQMLPKKLQHHAYRMMKLFDPRSKAGI